MSISLFHQSGENQHERKTMNQHYILVCKFIFIHEQQCTCYLLVSLNHKLQCTMRSYIYSQTWRSCETCVLSNCFLFNNKICLVKPVYKCHSREPEYVAFEQLPFLYRLKLHVLFITRENETVICYRGSPLWQV